MQATRDLLTLLGPAALSGMVLDIGAGPAELAGQWGDSPATEICLVEPNPQFTSGLQALARREARVKLRIAAVAPSTGRAVLHVGSMAALSSLREARALQALMPGLQIIDRPQVAALSVADLMAGLPRPGPQGNLLRLRAPGSEGMILRELAGLGLLRVFDHLVLHCGVEPLYEGAEPAAALRALLAAEGYLDISRGEADPDFYLGVFRLDPARRVQLDAAGRPQLSPQEAGAAARMARLAELEAAHAERAARAQQAEADLAAARADLAVKAAAQAALEMGLAAKTAEAQDLARQLAEVKELRAQDATLTLRLLALRDEDLADLRRRYQGLEEERAAQEGLLRGLTQKLTEAAVLLRQIDGDEAAGMLARLGAVTAPPAAPPPPVAGPPTPSGPAKPKTAKPETAKPETAGRRRRG